MVQRATYSIMAAVPGAVPDYPGGLASRQFKLDGNTRPIVRSVRGEWSPSSRMWAGPLLIVNADDPYGIRVLGPRSLCHGEHVLRRDTLDQRPTSQQHRVYHSI